MSTARNPFYDLIPNNSSNVNEDVEIEKWRKRGQVGAQKVKGLIKPSEGQSQSKQNNPFDDLVPNQNNQTPIKNNQTREQNNQLPSSLSIPLDIMKSITRKPSEAIPERVAAMGRGFTDIGEGLKQAYLRGKEGLGFGTAGEADKYTKQVEAERKFYESTPASKDILNKGIREAAASSPYLAIGGPLGMGAKGLLMKMLASGASGGAIKGTEFVPEYGSRASNVLEGATIGAAIPAAFKVPGIVSKTASTLAKPFKNAFSSTKGLEESAIKSALEHEGAAGAHQEAENLSHLETGKKNPQALQYAKRQHQQELAELPKENAHISPEVATHNLQTAENELKNIENNLGTHLNKGAQHDVRAAAKIDEIQNATRKEIGNMYDQIENNLVSKNIEIKNPRDAQQVMKDLTDVIKKGGLESSEARSLADELTNLEKSKSVKARDYLAAYRTARDYLREARKEAFTPGITDETRQAAKIRAGILEDKVGKMKEILEEGIGKEDAELLKSANSRWSKEVAPLYKNKLYNQIKYQGRLPDNIIKQLRGTEPGNKLIQDIIKKDPELLRNVVGQRFAIKPKEIHEPNEMMKEYIGEMPYLKNILEAHKEATQKIAQEKQIVPKALENSKNMAKRAKLENDISLYDKHIEKLKKLEEKKDISLKEKIKNKEALKKALSDRKKSRLLLGGLGGTLYGGSKIMKYLDKSNDLG